MAHYYCKLTEIEIDGKEGLALTCPECGYVGKVVGRGPSARGELMCWTMPRNCPNKVPEKTNCYRIDDE